MRHRRVAMVRLHTKRYVRTHACASVLQHETHNYQPRLSRRGRLFPLYLYLLDGIGTAFPLQSCKAQIEPGSKGDPLLQVHQCQSPEQRVPLDSLRWRTDSALSLDRLASETVGHLWSFLPAHVVQPGTIPRVYLL